jgi:hypothetical protein
MDQIGPTPRNTLAGMLADALAKGHAAVQDERKTPLLKAVSNILPVTDWAKTLDRVSYGEPLSTGKGMTTKPHPETMNALMSVPSVIQGARAASPLIQKGATAMARNALAPSNVPMQAQRGAIVYHGSPHTFDKFDMSKIGTGEGAQAYGHGLYFAESPGVAASYQKQLARQNIAVDGKPVVSAGERVGTTGDWHIDSVLMNHKGDIDAAIAASRKTIAEFPMLAEASAPTLAKLEALRGKVQASVEGNLYKVDLPDEHIAKMLDWDKPLSQQSPEAAARLEKALLADGWGNYLKAVKAHDAGNPKAMKEAGYGVFDYPGSVGGIVEMLNGQLGGAKAQKLLRRHDIPGVRYLDQGSRGTGQGTSNYVVFDDKLPKIVERNGKSLTQMLDDALKGSK